jgi:predicted transcriptional regulator
LRQLEIVQLIRDYAPITGDKIAESLGVGKATIRADFSILVMLGYIDAKPKVGYFLGEAITPKNTWNRALLELKVKDIQSIPVVLRDTSTIHEAVVTLFLENVGSLMVTDSEGSLIGIVSRKDLLKVTLGNASAQSMVISLVMTRQPNIITIGPEDTVLEAARRLITYEIDCLPVVNSSNIVGEPIKLEVVGRITKTNLTRTMLDLASEP